jgi:hypothetical protein
MTDILDELKASREQLRATPSSDGKLLVMPVLERLLKPNNFMP